MESHIIYLSPVSLIRQQEYLFMIKALVALNFYLFKNDLDTLSLDDIDELTERLVFLKTTDKDQIFMSVQELEILQMAIDFLPEASIKPNWTAILDNAVINDKYQVIPA